MRSAAPLVLAFLALGSSACNDEPANDTETEPVDDTAVDDTGTRDTSPLFLDEDRDGYTSDVDCDDDNYHVHPDAIEQCDGLDNDCNGQVDEPFDLDQDGWAICFADCDDTDPTVHPEADEIAYDGIDQDCSGTDLVDVDGDGFVGEGGGGDDCDDVRPDVNPAQTEIPKNGLDDDCRDGDDIDGDDDGYGDIEWGGDDCDDVDPEVHPGAREVCDDVDDDCDGDVSECACRLTAVDPPTPLVRSGSAYGQWMADPLETLGSGIHWEMDSYLGSTLTEYASLDDLVDRASGGTITLPYGYNGTGAVVYDGYLYYNQDSTDTLVKYDIATGDWETLTLTGAGYHNTYHYEWGGYSDIDFAVDELGLWVLYATATNEGRMVASRIDPDSFSITDTWETNSDPKTSIGNAFMICGVMYTVDSYNTSTTTVNYAYDTTERTSSRLRIPWTNAYGYNSMIAYNPTDETIYAWDNTVRVTYPPITE